MVLPTGNVPGASLPTPATPQLSEATGEPSTTPVAPHCPGLVFVVTFAGQVIDGNWSSTTVTSCVQVAMLPWVSVAVQMTLVVPTLNTAGALLVTLAMP